MKKSHTFALAVLFFLLVHSCRKNPATEPQMKTIGDYVKQMSGTYNMVGRYTHSYPGGDTSEDVSIEYVIEYVDDPTIKVNGSSPIYLWEFDTATNHFLRFVVNAGLSYRKYDYYYFEDSLTHYSYSKNGNTLDEVMLHSYR